MGECDDPNPVWLFKINDPKGKSLCLPTATLQATGFAKFRMLLELCKCPLDRFQESVAQLGDSAFVKMRRVD
jgi:hypothetical protein